MGGLLGDYVDYVEAVDVEAVDVEAQVDEN